MTPTAGGYYRFLYCGRYDNSDSSQHCFWARPNSRLHFLIITGTTALTIIAAWLFRRCLERSIRKSLSETNQGERMISVREQYDIVFVDSGLIGLWTAVLSKVRNTAIKILFYDRPKKYTLIHLEEVKASFHSYQNGTSSELDQFVNDVTYGVGTPVKNIEVSLRNIATRMGICIQDIPTDDISELLNLHPPGQKFFVGADEAKSVLLAPILDNSFNLPGVLEQNLTWRNAQEEASSSSSIPVDYNDTSNVLTTPTPQDQLVVQVLDTLSQIQGAFFTSPSERFFTDPVSGITYMLADYTHLTSLAGQYWATGQLYTGFEVSKLGRINDFSQLSAFQKTGDCSHIYNAIFFKKTADQITHDSGVLSSLLKNPVVGNVISMFDFHNSLHERDWHWSRIAAQQEKTLKDIDKKLCCEFQAWGYGGYCILNSEAQMKSVGFSEETAKTYHAILFFLSPANATIHYE